MYESDDRTIWCGNLTNEVTEELLHELFLQAGPLEYVKLMKDKRGIRSYAFIRYVNDVSVPYAINLFRETKLFSRNLKMHCRGRIATLPPPIKGHDGRLSIFMANPPGVDLRYAHLLENFYEERKDEQPCHSRYEQPSHSRDEQPCHSRYEQPSHSRDEQPSYSRDEQPSHSRDEQPSHSRNEQKYDDQLAMDTSQGNWTHRHHPYQAKDNSDYRDNRRFQDQYSQRNDRSDNWRDRRYNNRSYHHRRN